MTVDYYPATFSPSDDDEALSGPGIVAALRGRRSEPVFTPRAQVPLHSLARILNESVGITAEYGRGTPSPAGLRALECYVAAHSVQGLEACVYRYDPIERGLEAASALRPDDLLRRSRVQPPTADTESFHVFIIADLDSARSAYLEDAERFVLLEAGHIAQSMLLLAVKEGLAACPIGRFKSAPVSECLGLDTASHVAAHSIAFGRR